jgi:hypothetical protein
MKPVGEVISKSKYHVRTVPFSICKIMIERYHYAKGGSNTATFRHGLFCNDDVIECLGVAWWIPPTKSSALANYPLNWKGVLSLHRLVIAPGVPKNAASFLICRSIALIKRDPRWEFLITYADEWQHHTGVIYKASNWVYLGKTAPTEETFVDNNGRLVQRKAGPKTRTKAEMISAGFKPIGKWSRHRFGMKI